MSLFIHSYEINDDRQFLQAMDVQRYDPLRKTSLVPSGSEDAPTHILRPIPRVTPEVERKKRERRRAAVFLKSNQYDVSVKEALDSSAMSIITERSKFDRSSKALPPIPSDLLNTWFSPDEVASLLDALSQDIGESSDPDNDTTVLGSSSSSTSCEDVETPVASCKTVNHIYEGAIDSASTSTCTIVRPRPSSPFLQALSRPKSPFRLFSRPSTPTIPAQRSLSPLNINLNNLASLNCVGDTRSNFEDDMEGFAKRMHGQASIDVLVSQERIEVQNELLGNCVREVLCGYHDRGLPTSITIVTEDK